MQKPCTFKVHAIKSNEISINLRNVTKVSRSKQLVEIVNAKNQFRIHILPFYFITRSLKQYYLSCCICLQWGRVAKRSTQKSHNDKWVQETSSYKSHSKEPRRRRFKPQKTCHKWKGSLVNMFTIGARRMLRMVIIHLWQRNFLGAFKSHLKKDLFCIKI